MHTILYIGAGLASDLEHWLATGALNIVLVEPNPNLAAKLRKISRQYPSVTVVEAAITVNPTNNKLKEYNLPEAGSLHPATGLKNLFPGLKLIESHTVVTLSPEKLFEQYGPAPTQEATLIIQAPGEEQAIIQSLIDCNQLKFFSHVILTASPEPLYEGCNSAQSLLSVLHEYGYEITAVNQQDPDWPSWQLKLNPLRAPLDQAHDKIKDLQEQLSQLQTRNQQLELEGTRLQHTQQLLEQEYAKLKQQFSLLQQLIPST